MERAGSGADDLSKVQSEPSCPSQAAIPKPLKPEHISAAPNGGVHD